MACPACGRRYDPLAGLVDEPVAPVPAAGSSGVARPQEKPAEREPTRERPRPEAPAPRASETSAAKGRPRSVAWAIASVALALVLAVQAAWWQRGNLIRSPASRAWLEALCEPLGCRIPLPRLPDQLTISKRGLEPHPDRPDALRLYLELLNEAATPQALPVVQIELYDVKQNMTAAGRFPPRDYWSSDRPATIDAGAAVALVLDFAAPPEEASGFIIRLL